MEFIRNFVDEQAREGILPRLLDASQLRRTMEPRDKIYALLGLLSVGIYPSLEKVSYSQSVASLYAEVLRLCWDVDNTINMRYRVFYVTRPSNSDLRLPSWSVDWLTFREYAYLPLVPKDQAEVSKFHPAPHSSIQSTLNQSLPEDFQLRVDFIAFLTLLRSQYPHQLYCGIFPKCMSTQRECNTNPAQVRFTKVWYRPQNPGNHSEKETMRVDSEDVSTLSKQPIDTVKVFKSIHDHETSTCTSLRTNVFGPKAAAAPWPLGKGIRNWPRRRLGRLPCKQKWPHVPKISASPAGNFGMLPACLLRGRARNKRTSRSAAINRTVILLT